MGEDQVGLGSIIVGTTEMKTVSSIDKLFSLKGKAAIVTGGHSGIGKAIAEIMAEAGANVAVAARRLGCCEETCSEISQKYKVKCLPVKCDIANPKDIDAMVKKTIRHFKKVDILVNCAGYGGALKPVIGMDGNEWDYTLDVNLRGAFLCSRAAAREMIMQKMGKIINVVSMMAFLAGQNQADYCASKAGEIQLTRVLALELVKYNIQVNAICPGFIETPMTSEAFATERNKRFIQQAIPAGRLGDVNELKGIALYLASAASSYTIGACMAVDGGLSLR